MCSFAITETMAQFLCIRTRLRADLLAYCLAPIVRLKCSFRCNAFGGNVRVSWQD